MNVYNMAPILCILLILASKSNANANSYQDELLIHKSDSFPENILLSKSPLRFLTNNGTPKQQTRMGYHEFGWSPGVYPDPIKDPVKCGISSLITQQQKDNENSSSNDTYIHPDVQQPLYLCDPNSVLSQSFLKQIQTTLNNFTLTMSSKAIPCSKNKNANIIGEARNLRYEHFSHIHNDKENTIHSNPSSNKQQNYWITSKYRRSGFWRNKFSPTSALNNHRYARSNENDECCTMKGSQNILPSSNIRVAIAIVDNIDLQAVLRAGSYYTYEDEEDMINDAAQYFARYLYDSWDLGSTKCGPTGILIFLSIQQRACFISTGSRISSVLPWWRLEGVIEDIKPDFRHLQYGNAIIRAINDLSDLIEQGPPTLLERLYDFLNRFGMVLMFATFTCLVAVWGEYRDRWNRWHITEAMSKLNSKEKKEARSLQKEFQCTSCPICLDPFIVKTPRNSNDSDKNAENETLAMVGSDGRPLKLLRCGHVFDETCWKSWVSEGQGNPFVCPVCRRDVSGSLSQGVEGRAARIHDGPAHDLHTTQQFYNNYHHQRLAEQQILYARPVDMYGTFIPQNISQSEPQAQNRRNFHRSDHESNGASRIRNHHDIVEF